MSMKEIQLGFCIMVIYSRGMVEDDEEEGR